MLLSCDFALRATVETLKQVYRGELPFDRTIKVSLTVSSSTAKRLHLKTHGKRPVTIASARTTLGGSGTTSITLKLSKKLAKALGKLKSVGLTLQVTATSTATHKSKTSKKGITFKR